MLVTHTGKFKDLNIFVLYLRTLFDNFPTMNSTTFHTWDISMRLKNFVNSIRSQFFWIEGVVNLLLLWICITSGFRVFARCNFWFIKESIIC